MTDINIKNKNWKLAKGKKCGSCGSRRVQTSKQIKVFNYGTLDKPVELRAEVPVYRCADCEFMYTDREASELCHDAVCRYRDVMTPKEVREVRNSYNQSVEEFSKQTGIGAASINRWEKGALIQNKAMDNYLYLLKYPRNLDELSIRASELADHDNLGNMLRFPDIAEIEKAQKDSINFRLAA